MSDTTHCVHCYQLGYDIGSAEIRVAAPDAALAVQYNLGRSHGYAEGLRAAPAPDAGLRQLTYKEVEAALDKARYEHHVGGSGIHVGRLTEEVNAALAAHPAPAPDDDPDTVVQWQRPPPDTVAAPEHWDCALTIPHDGPCIPKGAAGPAKGIDPLTGRPTWDTER